MREVGTFLTILFFASNACGNPAFNSCTTLLAKGALTQAQVAAIREIHETSPPEKKDNMDVQVFARESGNGKTQVVVTVGESHNMNATAAKAGDKMFEEFPNLAIEGNPYIGNKAIENSMRSYALAFLLNPSTTLKILGDSGKTNHSLTGRAKTHRNVRAGQERETFDNHGMVRTTKGDRQLLTFDIESGHKPAPAEVEMWENIGKTTSGFNKSSLVCFGGCWGALEVALHHPDLMPLAVASGAVAGIGYLARRTYLKTMGETVDLDHLRVHRNQTWVNNIDGFFRSYPSLTTLGVLGGRAHFDRSKENSVPELLEGLGYVPIPINSAGPNHTFSESF